MTLPGILKKREGEGNGLLRLELEGEQSANLIIV